MVTLNDSVRRLFDGKNFAALTTLEPDGRPHSTVVWTKRDGDDIVFALPRTDARRCRSSTQAGPISASPDQTRNGSRRGSHLTRSPPAGPTHDLVRPPPAPTRWRSGRRSLTPNRRSVTLAPSTAVVTTQATHPARRGHRLPEPRTGRLPDPRHRTTRRGSADLRYLRRSIPSTEFGDQLVRAESRSSAAVPYVGRGHVG